MYKRSCASDHVQAIMYKRSRHAIGWSPRREGGRMSDINNAPSKHTDRLTLPTVQQDLPIDSHVSTSHENPMMKQSTGLVCGSTRIRLPFRSCAGAPESPERMVCRAFPMRRPLYRDGKRLIQLCTWWALLSRSGRTIDLCFHRKEQN